MHRRKPASAKQRKAQLQLKRAVKRGDAPQPDTRESQKRPGRRLGLRGSSAANDADVASSRRLQSSFMEVSATYLEESKNLASKVPVPRPITTEAAILDNAIAFTGRPEDPDSVGSIQLTCPKRPKWRYDMTKKEVEKNEEGMFNKWLAQTDTLIARRLDGDDAGESSGQTDRAIESHRITTPRSPTYFERNVEVWRQLWRVMEISQIILVLLDSRCPLIHFPASLSALVSDRKVILILTKADIPGPVIVEAWSAYLKARFPGIRVVQVESYAKQEEGEDHQGKTRYQPHLPKQFRERLVDALREVHAEMMEPPQRVRENPTRLKIWRPAVKKHIDWEGVLEVEGVRAGDVVGDHEISQLQYNEEDAAQETDQEPDFLTVGLIGQPNVGKSSLLNALFNTHKVSASKTPGKTKHFQTLFWTHDMRLVDCPGLVMPSFVPMEMQVLCGILPISRISAIPSCINYAARYLPLERIFDLVHPSLVNPPIEDKRTWREGTRPSDTKRNPSWTAMDILIAFAVKKGWVTAKAGRPDVYRAGNAILRSLAEGRIGWAFWPPNTESLTIAKHVETNAGIWVPHVEHQDEDSSLGSELEEEEEVDMNSEDDEASDISTGEVSEDEVGSSSPAGIGFGRFGALSLDAEDED